MSRRKKKGAKDGAGISSELMDQLIKEHGQGLDDPQAFLKDLTAAVMNRALAAEMEHHLGYEHGGEPPTGQPNRRNGTSSKRVRTDTKPTEWGQDVRAEAPPLPSAAGSRRNGMESSPQLSVVALNPRRRA